MYCPLPSCSCWHGSLLITATPSPWLLCSRLCLAIMYNCPIRYYTHRHTDIHRPIHTTRQTDSQTYTHRQTDRQTDSQTDRNPWCRDNAKIITCLPISQWAYNSVQITVITGLFDQHISNTVSKPYSMGLSCLLFTLMIYLNHVGMMLKSIVGHSPVTIKFPDFSRHFKWIFTEYRPLQK